MGKLFDKIKENIVGDRQVSDERDNPENQGRRRGGAYRRHFAGYKEIVELDEQGRERTIRVYAGKLYTPELTRGQRIALKLAYPAIWLLAAADLLFFSMLRLTISYVWYGALAQTAALAGLLWILMGLINYMLTSAQRTVGEWRASTVSLKRSTLVTAAAYVLCFLTGLVHSFYSGEEPGLQLQYLLGSAAGAGLLILWNRLEAGVVYTVTDSEDSRS